MVRPGDKPQGRQGEKGDMLAMREIVILPSVRVRGAVRKRFRGKENGRSYREHAFDLLQGMDKVLEAFERRHQIDVHAALPVEFKTACEQILCIGVAPGEIESAVAHHSDEQSITTAVIQKISLRVEEPEQDNSGAFRQQDVPPDNARIFRRDGTAIGFFQPVRFFRLNKAARRALKILYIIFLKYCSPEDAG